MAAQLVRPTHYTVMPRPCHKASYCNYRSNHGLMVATDSIHVFVRDSQRLSKFRTNDAWDEHTKKCVHQLSVSANVKVVRRYYAPYS